MIEPVVGKVEATVQFVGIPLTPRDGYLASVTDFLPSVQLLTIAGGHHLRAGAFVAGFTLECALKAFIAGRCPSSVSGLSSKPYGHDLEALWRKAADAGLAIDPQPPQWCLMLNDLHFENRGGGDKSKYLLRYQGATPGIHLPATQAMTVGLEHVVNLVLQSPSES